MIFIAMLTPVLPRNGDWANTYNRERLHSACMHAIISTSFMCLCTHSSKCILLMSMMLHENRIPHTLHQKMLSNIIIEPITLHYTYNLLIE